jgi:hypothetical protein
MPVTGCCQKSGAPKTVTLLPPGQVFKCGKKTVLEHMEGVYTDLEKKISARRKRIFPDS